MYIFKFPIIRIYHINRKAHQITYLQYREFVTVNIVTVATIFVFLVYQV